MPLTDDDVVMLFDAVGTGRTVGRLDPAQWIQISLGGVEDDDWGMVAKHEAAHLALNGMTTFGVFLQLLFLATARESASLKQSVLSHYISYCRTTHEVFATTFGVWSACSDYRSALAPYPAYR